MNRMVRKIAGFLATFALWFMALAPAAKRPARGLSAFAAKWDLDFPLLVEDAPGSDPKSLGVEGALVVHLIEERIRRDRVDVVERGAALGGAGVQVGHVFVHLGGNR